MGATLEAAVVRDILAWLSVEPEAYGVKVHGDAFMIVGTPDILACYHGRMLAIEVKRAHPGERKQQLWMHGRMLDFWKQGATEVQALQLSRWEAAGALAMVVASLKEVQDAVRIAVQV